LKAKLEVLLLLADGLRAQRLSLYEASDSWHMYVLGLAQEFEAQIEWVNRREHVLDIWRSFASSVLVARTLDSMKSVLDKVHDEIRRRLDDGSDPLEYLAAANVRAHTRVRDLLGKRGIEELLSPEPVALSVFWDQESKCSCASSSRLEREIAWAFQAHSLALWGTMVADHVIAHEYLSHLAPKSLAPWRQVREGWLMEALLSEIRNSPEEERHFDLFALDWFRSRISEGLGVSPYALYSSPGVQEVARLIQFERPDLFWGLTGEILRLDDGEEQAGQVEGLIQNLADLRPDELKGEILSCSDWSSLAALASYLGNRR
jgi:hypothetical protein